MKIRVYILLLLLALILPFSSLDAQYRQYYSQYIDQYKGIAIEQMTKYKIPASITLAQGLFESGAGLSVLAKYSNNHFGIKCTNSWKGKMVYHDDDAPNECFRAYDNARDSYEDHSLFLSRGPRYQFLFALDITDYRGWALGLKKAGYATDPSYANRLISIIESYQLYKYDSQKQYSEHHNRHHHAQESKIAIIKHDVFLVNDIVYIVARAGDSFDTIGEEFDISARKLLNYNDLEKDYTLQPGDMVFLHKKKTRAAKDHILYIVTAGDSMHSISQKFGIRLKSLYKMNDKDGEYVPMIGDYMRLR